MRTAERLARRARLDADTCLYRSLARYATARAAGHDARFVMAVVRDEPSTGHAWVEVQGQPLLEGDLARYLPTLEHPPREGGGAARDVRRE